VHFNFLVIAWDWHIEKLSQGEFVINISLIFDVSSSTP
jgi:hypothetical protein